MPSAPLDTLEAAAAAQQPTGDRGRRQERKQRQQQAERSRHRAPGETCWIGYKPPSLLSPHGQLLVSTLCDGLEEKRPGRAAGLPAR